MCGERKDNCVLYEKDRHVARITLNKPEKRNALDEELSRELCAALQKARDDDDVRAGVLTRSVPAAMWRGFRNSAWRKAFLS